MAITPISTNMAIIQALADLPNATGGLSASQLKAKFDEGGEALKTYINNTLIPTLSATTNGASGADQIGATQVLAGSGTTVQDILEWLYTQVTTITTAKIVDSAVTTAKIADANVTTAKLADSNITTAKIANDAVTTAKIANDAVTTAKIANLNVTTGKIADSNITTAKIADSNVTTAKIADANVTTAKIADSNVTTAKITDLNVTTGKLADGAVTTIKITDANVTTAKIADGAVTNAKIATGTLDGRYYTESETDTLLANVVLGQIPDGSLTDVKLSNAAGNIKQTALLKDGSTSMSGQFVTITGTAGTPSIAPTGDSDTGLFFSGANVFNFSAGGVSVITVSTASMVAVSTTSTASGLFSQVNASTASIASGQQSQVNASSTVTASGTSSQVNASTTCTASGTRSQVNASNISIASQDRSQINASQTSTASGVSSQVNASITCTTSGTRSQVNASFESIASGDKSQINVSENSTASAERSQVNASSDSEASFARSQVNASSLSIASAGRSQVNCALRVTNSVATSVAGGFAISGGASTANRKWHIFGETGNVSIAGTLSSSVVFTDYAEMFPNFVIGQQGYGLLQTLEGEYVRPAQEGEDVIGVTSATAGIALGDSPFCWGGRYEVNEWGERIYIDVPDMDYELQEDETEDDRPLIRVQKESENWNPELEQIPRSERLDEWSVVGLLGQVFVRLHEDTIAGDYVKAWQDGIGKTAASRTNIRVMKITQEYDAEKGYKIGKCFLK